MHWLRLTLATYFLLKIDHPLYFSSKKGRPSLNIPEWVTWHLKTKTPASPVSKSLENSLKRLQQGRIKLSKLILHIYGPSTHRNPTKVIFRTHPVTFLPLLKKKKKTTKSMNSHQKTHEYIKGDSPLFTLECNELVNTHSVILMIFQI